MKDEYMKLNKFVNLLVIGLVLTVAASGCRKKPVNTTILPGSRTGNPGDAGPGGAIRPPQPLSTEPGVIGGPGGPGYTGTPQGTGHPGWAEDAQILKAQTVYFEYDSSVIKTAEKPKVAAVADYLKAN